MQLRKIDTIWLFLLVIMTTIGVIFITEKTEQVAKMTQDLNDTGHLLTQQIKENQLLYLELNDMIERNNKLNNLDKSDPKALIKMACEIYDLDYTLAISIARLETANFTSDIYVQNNNVGGMRGLDGQWNSYKTLIEGVNEYVICLKDNYINQGLTTPELIQPKYCPTNDGGKNWLKQVKIIMKEEE